MVVLSTGATYLPEKHERNAAAGGHLVGRDDGSEPAPDVVGLGHQVHDEVALALGEPIVRDSVPGKWRKTRNDEGNDEGNDEENDEGKVEKPVVI
jgi:hypothetical protein